MSRYTLNPITESILEKIHQANLAYGTSVSDLAKVYRVSPNKLYSKLKEYRQMNNLRSGISNKKLGEAADKVAPNNIPFKEFV